MSIIAAGEAGNLTISIWLIWLGLALLMALFTGIGARLSARVHKPAATEIAIALTPAALTTFAVWMLVPAAYAALVPGAVVDSTFTGSHRVIISLIAPLAGLLTGLMFLLDDRMRELVGLRRRDLGVAIMWGMVAVTILLPIVWWSLQASTLVMRWLEWKHPSQHELLEIFGRDGQAWVRVGIVIAAVVITPAFEELLFRGMIQTLGRCASGRAWVGILIASVLFALIHAGWTQPPIFVFSVLVGISYELTGSLWTPITMHAVFNAFNIATSSAS